MSDCENIIESTGKVCGSDVDGPFHQRFCSDECADRTNRRELEELGITPDMLKDALDGYYECKEMIDGRGDAGQINAERASHSPYQSDRDEARHS